MKTLNTKLMVLLAAFSVIGVGCTNSSNQFAASASATYTNSTSTTTTGTGSTGTDTSTGTTTTTYTNVATFVPVSLTEFNNYVGSHPLNAPTNFQLTVSVQDNGAGRFGGTVYIGYTDTGVTYNEPFTANNGTNVSYSGMKDNGTYEAEFNQWFNNSTNFSGFFQDSYGAIVLVVEGTTNQGDAQGSSVLNGSVYYKNFAQSYATQSPYRQCWFIYTGPYACRSQTVMDKSSLVPSDGYIKLGTFTGLSKTAAFN